jgi:hypothetical protein
MMEVEVGKLASAAAAALVALLEFTEAKEEEKARLRELGERVAEEAPVCSLEELVREVVAHGHLARSRSAPPHHPSRSVAILGCVSLMLESYNPLIG